MRAFVCVRNLCSISKRTQPNPEHFELRQPWMARSGVVQLHLKQYNTFTFTRITQLHRMVRLDSMRPKTFLQSNTWLSPDRGCRSDPEKKVYVGDEHHKSVNNVQRCLVVRGDVEEFRPEYDKLQTQAVRKCLYAVGSEVMSLRSVSLAPTWI